LVLKDHFGEGGPFGESEARGRWNVEVGKEAGVLEGSNVGGRRDAVIVAHHDGDDFVGVGFEPGCDGLEVGFERARIEEVARSVAEVETGGRVGIMGFELHCATDISFEALGSSGKPKLVYSLPLLLKVVGMWVKQW
jgi:hypothetical protein